MLIYKKGTIDVTSYQQTCQASNLDPKKVVFLFPGNAGHHKIGTTLFSIKSGAQLASAAGAIGAKGYPTLSLPTTTMEQWGSSPGQKATVEKAIADLYRAVGAGYALMLPVRNHANTKYFSSGLTANGTEPSFWGGIQLKANKPLADHYIAELDKLAAFIALPAEEKQEQMDVDKTNPMFAAYLNGQQMQTTDAWLQAPKPSAPKTKLVTSSVSSLTASSQLLKTSSTPKTKTVTSSVSSLTTSSSQPVKRTAPKTKTITNSTSSSTASSQPVKTSTAKPQTLTSSATVSTSAPLVSSTATTNTSSSSLVTPVSNTTTNAPQPSASQPGSAINPLLQPPARNAQSKNSKPPAQEVPDTYIALYDSGRDAIESARALLDDYTKSDSALSRFFHGHWNRHHVAEVAEIVKQIDDGEIKTTDELLEVLDSIVPDNPTGSIARRIKYIKEQFALEDAHTPRLG